MFAACNFNVNGGSERAEIRVFLGEGGALRSANPETGLPEFDNENTTITIIDDDGTEIARGTTSLSADVAVGTKIIVTARVTTEAGVWSASKRHTVQAGINDIFLQLSKAPKSVGNILSRVVKNDSSGIEVTLKLDCGDNLIENVKIGGNLKRPITARDGIGRIYVLYDKGGSRHFTRFDVEGDEDDGFEAAVKGKLPSSAVLTNMAVDAKTGTIFVFDFTGIYCLKENTHNTFTCSSQLPLSTIDPSISTVSAVAAYNGTLFFTVPLSASLPQVNKLFACKAELSGSTLTPLNKIEKQLPKVRQDNAFDNNHTECTGLFADEGGVYCLLEEHKLSDGMQYALGQLVHYIYSGSTLTKKTEIGLNSDNTVSTEKSIAFDARYFSSPAGFIGYDEENIYIADDGVDIHEDEYLGWCVTGNKNRIAAFNRKTNGMSFDDAGNATWFAEYAGRRRETKIPRLLWSRDLYSGAVALNLKTLDGTVKPLVQNIGTRQQDKLMTARDSTGNVYVLYLDNTPAPQLHLERFSADGTKDDSFGTAKTGFTFPDTGITDLAVDFKTADVFLLKRTRAGLTDTMITAYMAKADNGYASFSGPATVPMPDVRGSVTIDSVAAFDGTLFFAMDVKVGADDVKKLYAYKMQTAGSFAFTADKAETELSQLWQHPAKSPMVCTGLFVDRKGVYGVLAQKNTTGGADLYALGKIVRYTYDGSTQLTPVVLSGNNSGLNPAAANPGSIGYDAKYFSYPAGFLGYDGDTLYIADDGVNIEEVNENFHVNGNKDRIMAFDCKNNTLSASSLDLDGATWFKSYDKYTYPETKMLLWEKGSSQYWVGDNGTEAYSPSSALSTTPSQHLTDVFCYDQNGNLYIVMRDGSDYQVKRFTPTDTGFNSTGDMKIKDESERPVSIAVDVSGGTNILYYGINVVPVVGNLRLSVQKIEWSDHFVGEKEPQAFISAENEQLTALAANKDGVFVGVKQIYEETVGGNQIPKYRLKVKKFLKGKHADGSVTVVENASSYVDPDNTDTPIPNPQPYSSSQLPYIEYEEAINDLQVVEGTLYAITSKAEETKKWNNDAGKCTIDKFKMSSALYKIGKTEEGFSGNAEKLTEKEPVPPVGPKPGVGYGFYRFIAVKPKKLVIASDGAYDVNGHLSGSSGNPVHNDNKVLTYDLDGNLNSPEEKDAAGKFSKELQPGSGFSWE
ncbi:hypothetical protein [Treponema socranskii]|uniref:hypothetical protein n=1 Tax=Treponema socranskii TaxID=53419 RepID=UPI001E5AF722|nr:hypothetical protein [Treponema socranskii]